MFFKDPRAAFANLARALVPGGRIGFHCWKSLPENPWMTVPFFAALQHVPPPTPPPPDAPGPFAFADADACAASSTDAGLAEIDFESRNDPMGVGARPLDDAVDFALQMGPASIAIREATPETVAKVRVSVRGRSRRTMTADGVRLATVVVGRDGAPALSASRPRRSREKWSRNASANRSVCRRARRGHRGRRRCA